MIRLELVTSGSQEYRALKPRSYTERETRGKECNLIHSLVLEHLNFLIQIADFEIKIKYLRNQKTEGRKLNKDLNSYFKTAILIIALY